MLLGWDVISRYRWSYSAKDKSLSVSLSEKTAEHLSPEIKQGPIVFPEYAGQCFKARVDTGHTGSILSASWHSRLPDIAYHETEIAGVGDLQYKRLPYVRVLQLRVSKSDERISLCHSNPFADACCALLSTKFFNRS